MYVYAMHIHVHENRAAKVQKKSHICKHMREKVQNILVFLPKTCIFTKINVTLPQFLDER